MASVVDGRPRELGAVQTKNSIQRYPERFRLLLNLVYYGQLKISDRCDGQISTETKHNTSDYSVSFFIVNSSPVVLLIHSAFSVPTEGV